MDYRKDIIQLAINEVLTKEERSELFWSIQYRTKEARKCLKLLHEKVESGDSDSADKRQIEIYERECQLLTRLDFLFFV